MATGTPLHTKVLSVQPLQRSTDVPKDLALQVMAACVWPIARVSQLAVQQKIRPIRANHCEMSSHPET